MSWIAFLHIYLIQYLFILSPPIYLATPTTATYRVCIGVHPTTWSSKACCDDAESSLHLLTADFFMATRLRDEMERIIWAGQMGGDLNFWATKILKIMQHLSFQAWIEHVARKDACYLLFSWMGSNTCGRIDLCRERSVPATFFEEFRHALWSACVAKTVFFC